MQNPVDSLGTALRTARKKRNLTQRRLADKLHMRVRTIIEAEQGHSNPKFETVALLAEELNISEPEIPKYITLCQQADTLKNKRNRRSVKYWTSVLIIHAL